MNAESRLSSIDLTGVFEREELSNVFNLYNPDRTLRYRIGQPFDSVWALQYRRHLSFESSLRPELFQHGTKIWHADITVCLDYTLDGALEEVAVVVPVIHSHDHERVYFSHGIYRSTAPSLEVTKIVMMYWGSYKDTLEELNRTQCKYIYPNQLPKEIDLVATVDAFATAFTQRSFTRLQLILSGINKTLIR